MAMAMSVPHRLWLGGVVSPVRNLELIQRLVNLVHLPWLPGKALLDIAGKPMVVHVAERAKASGALEVWVATDDERVQKAVSEHGHRCLMTAASHSSGTDRIAEVAAKRLRSLGVRTWRRGRTRGAALTEREHTIAQLIAEGASNPEIAQRLFLSRKTVERHVSNLLKKVGVRNRAELAARVAELEVEGVPR